MTTTQKVEPFPYGSKIGVTYKLEYSSWCNMKSRCYNKSSDKYWGRKGIKVCKRWLIGENGIHPFLCFLEDMGVRPSPKHTLDRYPNELGNYEPTNCRWATRKEQGWSKVGKPRPDLAARNRKGKGKTLSLDHRKKIGRGVATSEAFADWNKNRRKRKRT